VPVAVSGKDALPESICVGEIDVRVGAGPVTLKVMPLVGLEGVAAWPG
jgi:hypothetical protein